MDTMGYCSSFTNMGGIIQEPQYLIGGLEYFLFFHILAIINPTDFHIFQRGRYTTNQI